MRLLSHLMQVTDMIHYLHAEPPASVRKKKLRRFPDSRFSIPDTDAGE